MSTWRYIFEQVASGNYTSNDLEFFKALNDLKQADPNINSSDYYRYITEYILALKQYMPLLSDDAKAKINNNLEEINNIFKTANQNAFTVDATAYGEIKEDLSSVWKGVYGATPAAAAAPTTPAAAAATVSEPDQETLNAAFAKYMGSSYNPNSPMDKGKMETVKNALKKFQEENNRPFQGSDEDLEKMRPIMNAAYQSDEYKKAVGVSGGAGSSSAGSTPTVKRGIPTVRYGNQISPAYVQTGKGKFAPATPEQRYDANTPIYFKNPRKGQGEYGKPNYVEMRKERGGQDVRPKSQYGGVAGSISNFLGDLGRTADDASRGTGRFRKRSR